MVVFSLFILVLMLAVAGFAVDYMRYEQKRASLQSTLDRAVLAAASLEQPLDPQTVVLDYFDKAGLSDYISADDIEVVNTGAVRKVSAAVHMDMNTTLLRFAGIKTLTAPAAAAAQETISNTEISLVLDVSGSMGWSTGGCSYYDYSCPSKIESLREAATGFVNILMCDPTNASATTNCTVVPNLVSINLVPYNQQVVAGETLLSQFNSTSEHDFSSCATFQDEDFQSVAITPDTPVQRTGHFDPWNGSGDARDWTCQQTDSAYDKWREIGFMEGDAATLRSQIASLSAGGNTSIDIGMKWGAALLDNSIQPIVADLIDQGEVDAAFNSRPAGGAATQKVIVLMTDGVNTNQAYLYDEYRSGPSPVWRTNEEVDGDYVYSIYNDATDQYYWETDDSWHDHAYGTGTYEEQNCQWEYEWVYTRWGWQKKWYEVCVGTGNVIPEPGNGAAQLDYVSLWAAKPTQWYTQFDFTPWSVGDWYGNYEKNSHLNAICSAAKEQGVTVFAVGFEVNSESANVMRNCASGDAYYFDADGSNLVAAFAAIAADISKLRLVN